MGRVPRANAGGIVYHALNRGNARAGIFLTDSDYRAFLEVLEMGRVRTDMRILGYCLMPNHWHLVLWPRADGDLSAFVGWLTLTHTQRWHWSHGTVGLGHLYQGPFRSFPVEHDVHLLTLLRYVERNAVQAKLVKKAQEWPWCSLFQHLHASSPGIPQLCEWPIDRPTNWLSLGNDLLPSAAKDSIQLSIRRGRPFGDPKWQERTAHALGLQATMRSRGRPRID
jgi:putative transposase